MSNTLMLEKFSQKWGSKFDYSITKHIKGQPIEIICKEHKIKFNVSKASKHLKMVSGGCPECIKKQRNERGFSERKTTEQFIIESKKVHGKMYDYSMVIYLGNIKKVKIICKKHGEFEQYPKDHVNGHGCLKCAADNISNKISYTQQDFLYHAEKIHGDRFDYSEAEYTGSHNKIKIICKEHGSFYQLAYNHLAGQIGCQKCHSNDRSKWQTKENEKFKEEAIKVHNGLYCYDRTKYIHSKRKVIITCKKHGDFQQTPNCHLKGNGCPRCIKRISYPCDRWLDSFNNYRIIREYHISKTRFTVDGFDPETNTIYLFHGDFWHGNPKKYAAEKINPRTKTSFGELYENTIKMENKLKQLGYNLNVIWENDWKTFIL